MSFLLPEHVIKPDLLESGKYRISKLTAKQLLLRVTESILHPETCKHFAEETHALLPLSSKEAGARGSGRAASEHSLGAASEHSLGAASVLWPGL